MNTNFSVSWKGFWYFFIVASIGAVVVSCNDQKEEIVAGNQVTEAEYRELVRKARAGDPSAQLGLSLVLDGTEEGEQWLEKAARSDYPPAVDALARQYMLREEKYRYRAREMLHQVAINGYYPAILELASCEDEGRCGKRNPVQALTWATLSRTLAENGLIEEHLLVELEARLRGELRPDDIEVAKKNASEIAKSIRGK